MERMIFGLFIWMYPILAMSADPATVELERLPAPSMSGGRPLMEVLRDRKSTREFSAEPLSREQLANLLWAAFGVNRPETGQRTAPCTMNLRSIDLYVATTDSIYRYDAEAQGLVVIGRRDVRAMTGGQDYVKVAPLALIYVADYTRFAKVAVEERAFYAAVDTGLIAQNTYLYSASAGLGCVVHMPGDRTAMRQALALGPDQHIVLVHSVGHPAR